MKRERKPVRGLVGGGICLALASLLIIFTPPVWWSEIPAITLIGIGMWFGTTGVSGSRKKGLLIMALMVGLLVMRRLGILNWVTGGLLAVTLGLISLIN